MIPLAAYADRLSVRSGQSLKFFASGQDGVTPRARIARVRCADPNPEIGGVQVSDVATLTDVGALHRRSVPLGSYAEVLLGDLLKTETVITLTCLVKLTKLPSPGQQSAIWAIGEVALSVGEVGHLHSNDLIFDVPPLVVGDWYRIAVSVGDDGNMTLSLTPYGRRVGDARVPAAETYSTRLKSTADVQSARVLRFGAANGDGVHGSFNGLIEAPEFARGGVAHSGDPIDTPADQIIARWDFSKDIDTDEIIDVGPSGLHGRVFNAPTRAVKGAHWSGHDMVWRHAPQDYAAIHFHDDDIEDCQWPLLVEWQVPDDLASGQYALLLETDEAQENVPFWVVPAKGRATAKLAVLISTYTYTVYGNHARPEWSMDRAWQQTWRDQTREWGAYPHNPGDHHDLGLSTYNMHTDGSGISIASWHRPMLNVRLGYLTYPHPDIRASGLRHYPTDTHLTQWLDAKGIAYDVITDAELHAEGNDLLGDYTCVLTGSHPEYHTRAMLDALEAYRDGGGRFCYLGGNGFYWKIALKPDRDGVVEIRRAEGGIRAWAAEPGEYYNQFDGEYGGLWRRNGRPPQNLVGVGFSAQGNFVGSHYRLTDAARASRAAWIFEGIDGDTIGSHGFSGHGAAGFELDRADKALGTPEHAIVLAQSEDHPPEAPWVLVPEERLTHLTTIPGAPDNELIRADMTFFETANGTGAVFSTGSITYVGSLPTNGFDNDISRLTENVVRRFLDPTPFAM
ncbi:MAG: N,N-dimethylformamidase beta subunit family domain-containing protein [Pseudomonadota bacterium]